MSSLTIRKPQTLVARLTSLEESAVQKAAKTGKKTAESLRINGAFVQSIVTPTYKEGRYYRLFYVNGKRIAKGALTSQLLAS
jgi:hypothetical protein